MRLDDRFHFGKHSRPYAKTLRWVIENDAPYVVWCLEEEIIEIDLEADEELERKLVEEGYYEQGKDLLPRCRI